MKLKDLFQTWRKFKVTSIEGLLGYQIINDYLRLRSTALNYPKSFVPLKKPHKVFEFFLKDKKNSKHLREVIYIKPEAKSNTIRILRRETWNTQIWNHINKLWSSRQKKINPENVKSFTFKFVRNRLKAERSKVTHYWSEQKETI